jgi:outer membrane lipoprotein-sorting protein
MPRRNVTRFLRDAPASRLVALATAVIVVSASGVAIALAAGGAAVPPAKPTAVAVHDALAGPAVQGLSASITFTNHLVDASSVPGSSPLLTGATGRLWVGSGHRLRLELQSDHGDVQIVSNGTLLTVYDASSNTVYKVTLPAPAGGTASTDTGVPTVAEIQKDIDRLLQHADLAPAIPSNVAGRPAYTLRASPRHDGGLLGRAELAFDAARGVPLRFAVYATGNDTPVLELKATGVSYGDVPASTFAVAPPAGAKVVDFDPSSHGGADPAGARKAPTVGLGAVKAAVPFTLSAPDALAGLPRKDVRLVDVGGHPAALVLYGQNLGGIAVLEQAADSGSASAPAQSGKDQKGLLPTVSIDGATGQELDTALGSVVRFTRRGVSYTVLGSVPPAAAEAAARGL